MNVRLTIFSPWADSLEDAGEFLARLGTYDLGPRLPPNADDRLKRMARLDCDWFGECVRCFAALGAPTSTLPSQVVGPSGFSDFAKSAMHKPADEIWWLLFIGQHPQHLGPAIGNGSAFLKKCGVRILLYAFDEASRFMTCFRALAPSLAVLIHDEAPLDPAGEQALSTTCLRIHRSWVANVVPFTPPFNPEPEQKIVFLGSQLGLTPHRERQIAFLRERFKDRFVAIHDHSLAVGDRYSLNRFAVSLCPEGRKFTTLPMARTHTDRPFWSGCLGLVPVSENSKTGGRLDDLAADGRILRYGHGDLTALAECCERGLATPAEERRRIYDYFNRHETVGTVVADAIAAASDPARMSS